MNYYHLNIYEQICKTILFQYHKTVTFNISVSQSSASVIHGAATPSDLPSAIESKISSIHMTMQHGTKTSLNRIQVLHHV